MSNYEKALELWHRKNITTDAELAEALNGHSIAFAYGNTAQKHAESWQV